MQTPDFLSGQTLLAMPGIGDPRFDRAVIAMCRHDDHGAIGIGIGHEIAELGFHDLLAQFDIAPGAAPNLPVHMGGPVEPQRGFVLHSPDWGGQDSVHVADRWVMTGTIDILRAIAAGKGPKRWISALGYAGWEAGQIEGELNRHGWFVADLSFDSLLDRRAAARWSAAYAAAGIDAALLAPAAGRA